MNTEKVIVRGAGGGLVAAALLWGVGRGLGCPALVHAGTYAAVAAVLVGSVPPLGAMATVLIMNALERRRSGARMRQAWEVSSRRFGLRRTERTSPLDDTMHGDLDGAPVSITLEQNAPIQKAVTVVTVPWPRG